MPPRPAILETPVFDNYVAPINWRTRWSSPNMNLPFLVSKIIRGFFNPDIGFMTSRPFFDDAPGVRQWEPVRILGQGGFGLVGVWEKKDQNGQTIDELAIKEVRRTPGTVATCELDAFPLLSREAVIQRDLNLHRNPSILHLRGYKVFAHEDMSRYYFEICPYGDLSRLRKFYRIWDQYLPELFLWHVFHHLALAVTTLEQVPPEQSEAMRNFSAGPPYSTVHFDIKPSNIFLDYPQDGLPDIDATRNYPAIKLSDFGLSVYTQQQDPANPRAFWFRRTPHYDPPEQRGYGAHWRNPPTGALPTLDPQGNPLFPDQARAFSAQRHMNRRDVVFGNAHNVWCIAKVIYELLTLAIPTDLETWEAKTEGEYIQRGFHSIGRFATRKLPDYSEDLRDLVRDCLHPNPQHRPATEQLTQRTLNGLIRAKQDALNLRIQAGDPHQPLPEEMVCWNLHQMNQMPMGTGRFLATEEEFNWIIHSKDFFDPTWPTAILPLPKWHQFLDRYRPTRPQFFMQGNTILYGQNAQAAAQQVMAQNVGVIPPPVFPNQQAGLQALAEVAAAAAAAPAPAPTPADNVPIHALPTRADYNRLDKRTLAEELVHRNNALILQDLMRPRSLKASLIDQLMAMDQAGNLGRGANLG